MKKSVALLLFVALAILGLILPANETSAGEAKEKLERTLIGQWKVPKNRYREAITFDFTTTRKFECVHTVPKEEPITWSGDWKARTTHGGLAKAYLIGRNQANPEKYLKAIITGDKTLENFMIVINFNYKSKDKSYWKSKLIRASAAKDDDALEDDEFEDDEFEDEDFEDEDFEDEDFEDEEDEDFEDEEDEDFEEDDEFEEDTE